MRTIQYRRAQRQRLLEKRKHNSRAPTDPNRLGFMDKTPKSCSCWMCGNPRKYFGACTFQEKKNTQEKISDLIKENDDAVERKLDNVEPVEKTK